MVSNTSGSEAERRITAQAEEQQERLNEESQYFTDDATQNQDNEDNDVGNKQKRDLVSETKEKT